MITNFYVLHPLNSQLFAQRVAAPSAARALTVGHEVVLASLDDLLALASSRKKLLYVPSVHYDDAPLESIQQVA